MVTPNKKYYLSFLLLLVLFIFSCEKDDACTEPTTPNLVIRLYDTNSPANIKSASELTVIALPNPNKIYENVDKDSLVIPLNVNTNFCRFKMIKDTNEDIIELHYDREDIFVSKACGYKSVFHNLVFTIVPDSYNWIKNKEIINSDITIDNLAHVKIFH